MKYIAILHKNEGTAYGVTLPDFPGCFSAADTLDEVQANAQEAVELYAEGEAFTPPVPMTFEKVAALDEARDGVLMLVEIRFDFLDERVVPVNISMPAYMRDRIGKAAKAAGMTRSAYLVQAARAYGA
ncbi:MAG: type II toxin-antitoxin system HicB family antitoxin [Desulfovibrio sp.]|nr:type II toxin-antitoxin system HicB family antitoxin [Desulfovibrio sp.]